MLGIYTQVGKHTLKNNSTFTKSKMVLLADFYLNFVALFCCLSHAKLAQLLQIKRHNHIYGIVYELLFLYSNSL